MTQTTKVDRVLDALKTHKVLVDTCFLMHRNFDRFLGDYSSVLQQNHMLIPKRVVQELERIEKLADHRLKAAQNALGSVRNAISKDLAEIRGEPSDDHTNADNVISRVVEQHLSRHSIAVLTNDRGLRDWIYKKKRSGCFNTKNGLIMIRFAPQTGTVHIWGHADANANAPKAIPSAPPRPRMANRPNVPQPFATGKSVATGLDAPLKAQADVEKNGVFRKDGRSVRLVKKLASGGEGAVYETDQPGFLCKIYHPNRLTVGAQRKIELMTTRKVNNPAICWPSDSIIDADGIFRGFLMPRGSGDPLGHGLFIPTVWLKKRQNWGRRESVRLAIRVLEQIDYLHRMGVLLGDINPMNILVQDENTIFFVDCDSFQVEGFPCPVGSPNFVAPEIQGVDFSRFLRTKEHELFAVATLLFMIMMPGKSPYSHQGGQDGAANIRKMHFPYPLKEKGSAGAPEGAWRFCWSYLTRPIREAFHESFHEDYKGQPRVPVSIWLRVFREYDRILSKDNAVFRGPAPQYGFDLSILPHNFRRIDGKGPLPVGGETDLQRSVRRMAAYSVATKKQQRFQSKAHAWQGQTVLPTPPTPATPSIGPPSTSQPNPPLRQGSQTISPFLQPIKTRLGFIAAPCTHLLVWPIIAPLKALLEVIVASAIGAGIGALLLGFLYLLGGGELIAGLGLGANLGVMVGVSFGLYLAYYSIARRHREIMFWAIIGIMVGSVAVALFAGSHRGIIGAWLGLTGALLIWRQRAGRHRAAEYLRTWWGNYY